MLLQKTENSKENIKLTSVLEVKHYFQRVVSANKFPESLLHNLTTALKACSELEIELLRIDALPFWNANSSCFTSLTQC